MRCVLDRAEGLDLNSRLTRTLARDQDWSSRWPNPTAVDTREPTPEEKMLGRGVLSSGPCGQQLPATPTFYLKVKIPRLGPAKSRGR